MARSRSTVFVCLILLTSLSPAAVQADEILLNNGDRIHGTIVKMADELLTVTTPYADDLKLNWKDVRAIVADRPMHVELKREFERATLSDVLMISPPTVPSSRVGNGSEIPIAEVRAINAGPVRVTGNATVGGNSTQGNTQTMALNAAARVSIRSFRERINVEAKYNYGEALQHVTARNMTGGLEYNFFITPKLFALGTGLAEKDQFQNLTLRTTFSGGLGYQVFETARAKVSTEAAVGYVNEHFVDRSPTITPTSRLAVRWEYGLVPERLVLWQRTEGYYDLGGGNALRVRSDQGVRITLYKNLFFNLEEDFRYNSQPAPGRKSTDSAVIFGVGYALD